MNYFFQKEFKYEFNFLINKNILLDNNLIHLLNIKLPIKMVKALPTINNQ